MIEKKRSASEWSAWIGEEFLDVHVCDQNDIEDVGILHHRSSDIRDAGWVLASTWKATEQDVIAGEAPEIGGILSSTEIRIKFCPFCGARLQRIS